MKLHFLHSRWKSSLAAGVSSAVVTAGLLYLNVQRTQAEILRLRQENEEQSLKLLQPSAAEKRPDATPTSLPVSTPAPKTATPAPLPAAYRNEGHATPVATLQTFAWACDNGDVAALAKLITFEGEGREKVAAFVAQLPESQRASWRSPEELAATVCIGTYLRFPYPLAEVIDLATTETVRTDRVRLRLPGTALDGGNYQKTPEGWKFVIPYKDVEQRLKSLAAQTTAAPAK